MATIDNEHGKNTASAEPLRDLGYVRTTVLNLPEYDLKILLHGYPAHSIRCLRSSAQRDRRRQPDYDPADRVRNECLDVVCDCGTDGKYARYLEDQVAELHRLAVEASRTDSTSSKVRDARDQLVSLCLSLGGDAPVAPAAHEDEWTNIPPEIVEIVTVIGPAQWSRTPAYTPEEHGEGVARSVRLTAEHFNQGDEPQHMQMLVREDTDIVIGYIGTSPHSGQIARALAGAWNHLHQLCLDKAGGES